MLRINKNKRIRKIIVLFLSILCLQSCYVPVANGATKGTSYVAKATSYYKHPVTGEIEDAGNNQGLGQSMTESVLYKKALIEVEETGKIYATVRFYLTDNIGEVEFQTQKRGANSYKKVSYEIMQENIGGEYCSDYRIAIPTKDAIVRVNMHITAMGRAVTFYFDFSNLKAGNGDFITSIDTSETVAEEKVVESNTKVEKEQETAAEDKKNESSETKDTIESTNEVTESTSEEVQTVEELLEQAQGLTLSTERNQEESLKEEESTEVTDGKSLTDIPALPWTLVVQCILIITIPAVIIIGLYFLVALFLQMREER